MQDKIPFTMNARGVLYAQCLIATLLVYAVRADSFRLDQENWPDVIPRFMVYVAVFAGQLLSLAGPIFLMYQNRDAPAGMLLFSMVASSFALSGVIWLALLPLFT